MTIGERIKKARKAAGITQKGLAEMINSATGTIQQYELGKRQPRLDQLQKIARVLEIPVVDLLPIELFPEQYQKIFNALHFLAEEIRHDRIVMARSYDEWEKAIALNVEEIQRELSKAEPEQIYYQLIITEIHKLNCDGLKKAVSLIEELLDNPQYQWETPENAGKAPNTPSEGKDTTQDN